MNKFILSVTILFCISCNKSDTPVMQSPPTVMSFLPVKDSAGGVVTITGTNFSSNAANNIVQFNGIPATVTSATATRLAVVVPAGAARGFITVSVSGQTATPLLYLPRFYQHSF